MNTCDTCKHWEQRTSHEHGQCLAVKSTSDGEVPLDGAAVKEICTNSGEYVDSWLLTGPKFGCIHYEAKQ